MPTDADIEEAHQRIDKLERRVATLERIINDLGNTLKPRTFDGFQTKVTDEWDDKTATH